MSTRLSDEELIRQYLSGQPTHCFKALYDRYVNKVYRRCLSMTKDPSKAEDFTHDIFLKVFNKLDAFQERSSFSTWLYSISFNYCSDQIRLARRVQMTDIEDSANYNIPDATEEHLHEETLHLVNRAMKSLSANEQALLRLKYEDGMSIATISAMLNLKESTVKMRLKRSRDKIYKLYSRLHTT
ncbi:RNA polymerase sigma factor [Spirosoma sp.]|uniref:RNA polymerase sigma factor n=1 Tax=Spirosoma sp. TaxID=1899569 RepID=UPI0026219E6E|nr:RNA polymerase sigma factor [Spirosoma sp.]MCX6219328.1 RNA polymerase sigma factor [Spirosoma sp.]